MKKVFTLTINAGLLAMLILVPSCQAPVQQQKVAKNVIFLIGDGMGLNQIVAAQAASDEPLAMESVTHTGLQKNQPAKGYITDSAASGTALASGKKTYNGAIGVDTSRNDVESILVVAENKNKATGLVSTSSITHATPAAFIAHDSSRNNYEAIAADFLDVDVDVIIGGGLNHFTKRADGRDLAAELKDKGYIVVENMAGLAAHQSGKIYALTASEHNPSILNGRGDMLPLATKKAIELLNQDQDGFFLMIEGSQIDWGGHQNSQEYVITEMLDFDKAVKEALDFAKKDGETLVVITADHETGGMVVLNRNNETGEVRSAFTTGGHTGAMIPVFAYGPGAEQFTGVFDNTEFKEKFIKAFAF